MKIYINNDPQEVVDKHFSIKCPHCGVFSCITAISIPRFEFVKRYKPKKLGIVYLCEACNETVFLKFKRGVINSDSIDISDSYEEIERPQESFDFKYLSENLAEDFREALTCYSNSCFNAFGAMCRRCVQSISTELGAKGSDKVLKQLNEIKDLADIDDETFELLKQVIIAGHDGAHPHLPVLSPERAEILLELMRDVFYQLFVRKAKIPETKELRKKQIEQEE